MKKFAYIIMGAALLCAACTKENNAAPAEASDGEMTLTVSLADTRIAFAGEADGKTKVAWSADDRLWVRSDTQPAWERGDCFTTSAEKISADGHSATFTGVSRKDGLLAVAYPYERVADGADNDVVLFDIPQSLALVPGNAPALTHAAVGFLRDGAAETSLQFLLGALKVGITGSGEAIGTVELIDSDEENALWGTLRVEPDYATGAAASIRMENAAAGKNSVRLTAKGVTLSSTPLEFYFMLPAGSLSKGFTLKVFSADGSEMKQFSATSAANAVVRGNVVSMPVVDYTAAPVFHGFSLGSGTEADPYSIRKKEDLLVLSELVNNEATHDQYADKYYVVTYDINMAGESFVPIGKSAALAFKGHFESKYGSVIRNLSADGESADNPASGLFGYAEGATISTVYLEGRKNAGTFGYVGGLVGIATDCTINSCYISSGKLKAGGDYAGGIAACMDGGTIESCVVNSTDIESGFNRVGGLVGELFDGEILDSYVGGDGGTIGGKQNVGGIVGWFDKGSIKGCMVLDGGTAVVGSGDGVGGLVGRAIAKNGATNLLDNCLVQAALIQGAYTVGGLVGYAYPDPNGRVEIYNCGMTFPTLRATACDSGGDPAKGDCMIAGICGWPRCSDSGSVFKAVNCYLYFAPGGLVCDLPMKNVSAAGFTGYMSVSAAGSLTVRNCVTNLGADDLLVGGTRVSSSSSRYGAMFAHTPDGRAVEFSHNYCVTGLPMYGVTGSSVVCKDNEAAAPGKLETFNSKLNEFVSSYTEYPLRTWVGTYPQFL
jgi:hypothetical protein